MKLKIQRPIWLSNTLVGFGFASFLSDANHELVPLLLPAILLKLVGVEAAPTKLGIVSGVSKAASGLSMFLSGWLSDRVSHRKPILLVGYFLTGAFIGTLAWAQSWTAVLVITTIAWIGRGMISAPRNALIADSVEPQYYGHAFGYRQALDTLGAVCGPFLVYLLANEPPQAIMAIAFIPGILAFLLVALLIKEQPHAISPATLHPLSVLSKAFYVLVTALFIFGLANFNRTLLILRVQETMTGAGYSQALALSAVTILYIFRNIIQTIAAYMLGALSDRIGSSLPLGLFGFVFFGLSSLWLMWPSAAILALLGIFFLSGVSAGAITSIGKSFAADLLPAEHRGTGFGILQVLESFSDLCSSIIVGYLWAWFSPEIGFLYGAIMSFIAAFVLMFVKK